MRLQSRLYKNLFYVPLVVVKFVPSHIICHFAAGFIPSTVVKFHSWSYTAVLTAVVTGGLVVVKL